MSLTRRQFISARRFEALLLGLIVSTYWAGFGAALAQAASLPTPESALGFSPGADRRLADWSAIVRYFQILDAASDRVQVEEMGRTSQGRPLLLVTLSAADNLARLEELRRLNLRLADPRQLTRDAERQALAEGRVIVALTFGIHANEVGGPLAAVELAYRLASSAEDTLLRQAIVLLVPSLDPDGTQEVAEWVERTEGQPWEGEPPPNLGPGYAGHDLNRDWYMLTQVETRLVVRQLHDRWRPQVVLDAHQMGPFGARLFVPPYLDPYEPNIDPLLVADANALGAHVAARLTASGRSGAVVHAQFDSWAPGRAYSFTHGGVRLLVECASARLAAPIEVAWERLRGGLGYDARRASWNYPRPWPGGTWRLGDIVDYLCEASLATLGHAASQREQWLRDFLTVGRRACAAREPFAFAIPAAQRDPLAASKLLETLRAGAVEIGRAAQGFTCAGEALPAGSHLIRVGQPYGAFAKMLLERQEYPDLRLDPGGAPQGPYDVTAHTLPLLMGVDVRECPQPFQVGLDPVADGVPASGQVSGRGRYFALGHGNPDLLALGRLLAAGERVFWTSEPFRDGGQWYAPGTLVVPAAARTRLAAVARELPVFARGIASLPRVWTLRLPRVGLYRSWLATSDEGWTRFFFEQQAGLAYNGLRDADVRAGHLASRFDVIVLPDQPAAALVAGHPRGTLPDEYCEGLGPPGVAALRQFVVEGGTLIALNRAALMPLQSFPLRGGDVLSGGGTGPRPGQFSCRGAILRVKIQAGRQLTHGLPETLPIWFEDGPAFALPADQVLAGYAEPSPLLSGQLVGGEYLHGAAAWAEVPLGRGRVVLFGFRPQYRGQSWATYVALLNAIYSAAATPRR